MGTLSSSFFQFPAARCQTRQTKTSKQHRDGLRFRHDNDHARDHDVTRRVVHVAHAKRRVVCDEAKRLRQYPRGPASDSVGELRDGRRQTTAQRARSDALEGKGGAVT